MKRITASWGPAVALVAVGAFSSCSSTPPIVPVASNADIPTEIAATESGIADARNRQIDVLSPRRFARAEKALNEAKKARHENESANKIFEDVAKARS